MISTWRHHNPRPAHHIYIQILAGRIRILNAHMWLWWFFQMPKGTAIGTTQWTFRWLQQYLQILLWIADARFVIRGNICSRWFAWSCHCVWDDSRAWWETVWGPSEIAVIVESLFASVLVGGGGGHWRIRVRRRGLGEQGRWGGRGKYAWGTWWHRFRHVGQSVVSCRFSLFTQNTQNAETRDMCWARKHSNQSAQTKQESYLWTKMHHHRDAITFDIQTQDDVASGSRL